MFSLAVLEECSRLFWFRKVKYVNSARLKGMFSKSRRQTPHCAIQFYLYGCWEVLKLKAFTCVSQIDLVILEPISSRVYALFDVFFVCVSAVASLWNFEVRQKLCKSIKIHPKCSESWALNWKPKISGFSIAKPMIWSVGFFVCVSSWSNWPQVAFIQMGFSSEWATMKRCVSCARRLSVFAFVMFIVRETIFYCMWPGWVYVAVLNFIICGCALPIVIKSDRHESHKLWSFDMWNSSRKLRRFFEENVEIEVKSSNEWIEFKAIAI